jgi:hypothetical protein
MIQVFQNINGARENLFASVVLQCMVIVGAMFQILVVVLCWLPYLSVQGCIQKFPDWPPGARTANGAALCS